ncbi:MAG: SDR family oxidoreductase [Burkholderiales bacterium]|nr:SDR family oxidoreductase [Burkholderiales bacterium]
MDMELRDKGVLVTGGSRGIGREIALAFAREGAHVAICARDTQQLERTGAEIRALGAQAHTLAVDLLQEAECVRAVDETAAVFGRFDVLVNNASSNDGGSFLTSGDDQLMRRLYVKTLASIRCSRAAVPHFRRVGGGRIICVGGTSARNPGGLPAGMGNAALVNFVKHLSDEVGPEQILVNVVHPSFCKTDRYPARLAALAQARNISLNEAEAHFAAQFAIRRIVEPADVAPLVVFLASALASAITGQSIAVDGGATRSIVY